MNGAPISVIHSPGYLTVVCPIRLHLPGEIVPATHKKAVRPPRPAPIRGPQRDGEGGGYGRPRERDEYRGKKDDNAPEGFRPQFAGVGRGSSRE